MTYGFHFFWELYHGHEDCEHNLHGRFVFVCVIVAPYMYPSFYHLHLPPHLRVPLCLCYLYHLNLFWEHQNHWDPLSHLESVALLLLAQDEHPCHEQQKKQQLCWYQPRRAQWGQALKSVTRASKVVHTIFEWKKQQRILFEGCTLLSFSLTSASLFSAACSKTVYTLKNWWWLRYIAVKTLGINLNIYQCSWKFIHRFHCNGLTYIPRRLLQ